MAATITSITGLQNLTNLQNFYADWNSLTTVDISGMSSLVDVDISDNNTIDGENDNSLTSINVTGCENILTLRLDDSNFLTNGASSVVGLSDLTSCTIIDLDQCSIGGTVDLSALTNLEFVDVGGNINITNLILPDTIAPINFLNVSSNALTQTSINNILLNLDENGISSGEIAAQGGTNASPSGSGLDAAVNLNGKGWILSFNAAPGLIQYNNWYDPTDSGSVCAGAASFNTFYASGSLGIGTTAYTYNWGGIPTADGWYKSNEGLSDTLYFITGGIITSTGSCPI